jgi:hypothetical protein
MGYLDNKKHKTALYKIEEGFLLDRLAKPVIAFSLRKLNSQYTGNCIKVRRNNDNAELDIGFDTSGDLDKNTLLEFVGGNSGFVKTWHDQSGNNNHAIQANNALQPRIVNAGTLEVNNNNIPALRAISGNSTSLVIAHNSTLDITSNISIISTHNPITRGGSSLGRIISKNDTSDYAFYLSNVPENNMRMSLDSNSDENAYELNVVCINAVVVTNNASAYYTLNGESKGTDTTIGGIGTSTNDLWLFNRSAGSREYDGHINEIIIFPYALSNFDLRRVLTNKGKYNNVNII